MWLAKSPLFAVLLLLLSFLMPVHLFAQDPDSDDLPWYQQMFAVNPLENELPEFEDSYGVAFRDITGDTLPDLYVVRFRDLNRLLVNQGVHGLFIDRTIQTGLGGNLMSQRQRHLELGASIVDFNNDGLQDVAIIGWGATSTLFPADDLMQYGTPIRIGGDNFPLDGNGGAWADVDLDGDLDLYITDEHYKNHLFVNNGYGEFVDLGEEYRVDLKANSQGASFADIDGDEYPDLYVCTWSAPDVFYRNVNGEYFEPIQLPLKHLVQQTESNGITFGDIDNDGDLDVLVTDRTRLTALYINHLDRGNAWQFSEAGDVAGLANPFPAYGSVMADFDNNGLLDVFFTNIGPNQLFLQYEPYRFEEAYRDKVQAGGRADPYSTGCAVADYDQDGDIDLFVANKDTSSFFYRNPLQSPNSIRIQLQGVTSNRDAVGAKVWLFRQLSDGKSKEILGYREVSGGSGYLSVNEPVLHFGVDPAFTYTALIRFPGGEDQQLKDLRAGQTYYFDEIDNPLIVSWHRLMYRAIGITRGPTFWQNFFLLSLLIGLIVGFIFMASRRYQWQNKQTTLFLISFVVLSTVMFLWMSGTPLANVLLVQLGVLSGLIAIFAIFMEKIHRLESQRAGYRQLLQDFSRQLILIKDNNELFERMAQTVVGAMSVEFSAVMTIEQEQAQLQAVDGHWPERVESVDIAAGFQQKLLDLPMLDRETAIEAPQALREAGVHWYVPLGRNQRLHGLLLLGPPANGGQLHLNDLQLLQISAGQAAIAIENNNYIKESQELIKRLTETEIREKYVLELENQHKQLEQLYRELQNTQSQLIQSEKMAGLGQLVAGIAHELNNPISFVYANMKELREYSSAITELLKAVTERNGQQDAKLAEQLQQLDSHYDFEFIQKDITNLIDESLEGSQRVRHVVQNLRNFSRLDEAEFKEVDLHEGLDSTLLLLNNEIKDRIEVKQNYGDIPAVYCNPGNINQVFMNVLVNATQAIEGSGSITITTKQVADTVHIAIEDSGKGIPAELHRKIFDPFFTTKPIGDGTGLGLSISYNIVKKHGGDIRVASEAGEGTIFTIILPVRAKIDSENQASATMHSDGKAD